MEMLLWQRCLRDLSIPGICRTPDLVVLTNHRVRLKKISCGRPNIREGENLAGKENCYPANRCRTSWACALFGLRCFEQHTRILGNSAAHERSRLPRRGATRIPSESFGAFLADEAHSHGR